MTPVEKGADTGESGGWLRSLRPRRQRAQAEGIHSDVELEWRVSAVGSRGGEVAAAARGGKQAR